MSILARGRSTSVHEPEPTLQSMQWQLNTDRECPHPITCSRVGRLGARVRQRQVENEFRNHIQSLKLVVRFVNLVNSIAEVS